MKTKLLFIRHGLTESNINGVYAGFSDEDLNLEGYQQVRLLSSKLKELPISEFYSSPLKRTMTTAKILSEASGKEIITHKDLIEIDFGDWEGLSKEEVEKNWKEIWDQLQKDPGEIIPPNGESLISVIARAKKFLAEVVSKHPNKTIAIITHEIVIKALIITVLQLKTSSYFSFEIQNSSLTTICFNKDEFLLKELNNMSHILETPLLSRSEDYPSKLGTQRNNRNPLK